MTIKSSMLRCWIAACCFGIFVSVAAQSLWKDSYELNDDRARLRNGDNLIYAIAGTESFLTSSVDQILTTFQSSSTREMTKSISAGVIRALQVVDLQCMDLATSSNPLKQFQDFIREKKYKSSSGSVLSSSTAIDTELPYQWTEIFVVYNLDALVTPSDLKKLDFLFRITDKSFEFANVAVVLLWDLDQRALPTSSSSSTPGESLKDRLASVWTVGAPLVNGDALAGRIARTVTERTAMVSTLMGSSAKQSNEDWSDLDMPGASLSLHCLTARTHALTASATAIFNHKSQRAKALLDAAAIKAKDKANKPSTSSLASWGFAPISATLSNMTNWLSSAYQNATTITANNSTKVPKPTLWQSLFSQPSPSPKANKPNPSPANKHTLWSYLTRLGTWILAPIRSILSLVSKGVNHTLQFIQQTLKAIFGVLSNIPRKIVSLLSWMLSGPRKLISGVVWLCGTVMSTVGQGLLTVYRSISQYVHYSMRGLRALITTYPGGYLMGVKKMYAMIQTVPGHVMKGVQAMRSHLQAHGYLPLLFSLLFAVLPGVIVAYGLYPEAMQRFVKEVWNEGSVLFLSPASPSEEVTRGRSTSLSSSQSRPRASSSSRHASPSPSPPKKHISISTAAVEDQNGSSSASASTSSSSRRKSSAATATSTVKESKTPKADRQSVGVKNDRKSISKSHVKSAKTQAVEEEEEEEERLRIAAELDVYKGTRSKTPMKRK